MGKWKNHIYSRAMRHKGYALWTNYEKWFCYIFVIVVFCNNTACLKPKTDVEEVAGLQSEVGEDCIVQDPLRYIIKTRIMFFGWKTVNGNKNFNGNAFQIITTE